MEINLCLSSASKNQIELSNIIHFLEDCVKGNATPRDLLLREPSNWISETSYIIEISNKFKMLSIYEKSLPKLLESCSLFSKFKNKLTLVVPLNFELILSSDEIYLKGIDRVYDYKKNNNIDMCFLINKKEVDLFISNNKKIIDFFVTLYSEIPDFSYDFFQMGNRSVFESDMQLWIKKIEKGLVHASDLCINIPGFNKNKDSFGGVSLAVKNKSLYISPIIFERIVYVDEVLKVGKWSVEEMYTHSNKLVTNQLQYAQTNKSCRKCGNLNYCVGKNVLTVAKKLNLDSCIFGEKIMRSFEEENYKR